jgi:uncharacterized peroxidase-related enzyme
MPYIKVEEHLPGITGLLEYRRDSAAPIRELTQILLRGPSTLSAAERELIATVVSDRNECRFCTMAHTAVANCLLGESETTEMVKTDLASSPVSEKMKALLTIAEQVQAGGKSVKREAIDNAKNLGATDLEIHDTILIAALFCLYNRYVDGLSTITPTDPEFYKNLAIRISTGYERLPQGYDHLKK